MREGKRRRGCLFWFILIILFSGVVGAIAGNSINNESTEKQKEDLTKYIGEEGSIGDLKLTVNSISKASEISVASGYLAYTPDSGKYGIINLTIKNQTKESQSFMLNSFTLIGPDDSKYVPSLLIDVGNKYITMDTVNPNLDVTGNIAFEIPKDLLVSDCKLKYSGSEQEFILKEK